MLQGAELTKGWRDLRLRRGLFFALLAGGALAALLLRSTGTSVPVLVELWMVAVVAALVWLQTFRCPACGERFFRYADGVNPFARKCARCGVAQSASAE
jgi:hypothetical protein